MANVKSVKSETVYRNVKHTFNPRNTSVAFNPQVAKWIDPGIPLVLPAVSDTIQTPGGLDIETPDGSTIETP